MPGHIDRSLLESPYPPDDPAQRRRPRWLVAAAIIVAAISVVGLWYGSTSGRNDADPDSTVARQTPDGPSQTATSTTLPAVELAVFTESPHLLHHPALLPAGWEACRVLDDSSRGDRFCDPHDPDTWVQVSFEYEQGPAGIASRLATATPIAEGPDGYWLQLGDTNEAAFSRGNAYIVVVNKGTIPREALLEIAASIPLVDDFGAIVGDYEVPIEMAEVTDGEVGALLAGFDEEPTILRRPGEVQVFTPTVSLYGFSGGGMVVPEFIATIPRPRLIDADRPVVLGEAKERNRTIVVWDQGGYGWRLEGRMTADEAAALARLLIDRIAEFPTA